MICNNAIKSNIKNRIHLKVLLLGLKGRLTDLSFSNWNNNPIKATSKVSIGNVYSLWIINDYKRR